MERQVGANPLQHLDYSYDTVDQLTRELSTESPLPQINLSHSYDPMGNRTQATSGAAPNGTTTTYSSNALNQYTQISSTTSQGTTTANLSHDANGNLTSNGSTDYVYDDADRLTQIVRKDATSGANVGKSEFVYDGFGRKVISREYSWDAATSTWALTPNSEVRRIYDGMDVIQERDSNNTVTVNYTRDGNIGGLLARSVKGTGGAADAHYFYHYDGGNVTQLTDGQQNVVAQYAYDAYGNLQSSSGAQAAQPYRYSTKEFHAQSGLYDYGFRFYSPALGRWINRDPIGEEGGLNLYGFVGNNSVNDRDEYGEKTSKVGVGIAVVPAPPVVKVVAGVCAGAYAISDALAKRYYQGKNTELAPPTPAEIAAARKWTRPRLPIPKPPKAKHSHEDDLPERGTHPYVPRKRWKGPDKPWDKERKGFPDKDGNIWKWDPEGDHWDIQHPDGSHTNIVPKGYPREGEVHHGDDNF